MDIFTKYKLILVLISIAAYRIPSAVTGSTADPETTETTDVTSDAGTTDATPDAGATDATPDAGTTDVTPDAGTTGGAPDAGTTNVTPDAGTTGGTPDSGTTDITSDAGTTGGTPDAGTTGTTPDAGTTDNTTSAGTTSNTTDVVTTSNTTDAVTTSNTTDAATTSNTTDAVTTSNTTDAVTTSNTTDAVTSSNTTVAGTTSNTTDAVTTSNTTDAVTTSNTTDTVTTSNTTDAVTTSNTTDAVTTSNTTDAETTSNVTIPVATTAAPTKPPTTKGPEVPNFNEAFFVIPLVISIDLNFHSDLVNPRSFMYQDFVERFHEFLLSTFMTLNHFKSVTVLGFEEGSTLCNYHVDVFAYNDTTNDAVSLASIKEDVNQTLKNGYVENASNLPGNITDGYITEHLGELLDEVSDVIQHACDHEYELNGDECISVCAGNHDCENGGVCYVMADNRPACRCNDEDDGFVYHGTTCALKVERLTLSSGEIAAIAGGVGGGLILILLVALVCTCRRKPKEEDPLTPNYTYGEESVPMTDYQKSSSNHPEYYTQYDSQQYSGSSSFKKPLATNPYSQIDTEKEYSIKRPKVYSSSNPGSGGVVNHGYGGYDGADNEGQRRSRHEMR